MKIMVYAKWEERGCGWCEGGSDGGSGYQIEHVEGNVKYSSSKINFDEAEEQVRVQKRVDPRFRVTIVNIMKED